MVERLAVNNLSPIVMDKRNYQQRAEYLKKAVTARRKRLKAMAIEYKGGKCIFCGYGKCNDALDFHHINSREKEFGLSVRGLTRSWKKISKELDKCILVCANCHRELHAGILQLSKEILECTSRDNGKS
jgi:5-methylcytosine-specific restriction endonuclease McrA